VNRIVRTDDGEKETSVGLLDSYKFMASGLGSLADNLDSKECANLRKCEDEFELYLLKRKGVYIAATTMLTQYSTSLVKPSYRRRKVLLETQRLRDQ
jgi:hypothetical protein